MKKVLVLFLLCFTLFVTACADSDDSEDSLFPSDNPEDYNKDGEYKPIDGMTDEEIEDELEGFLEDSIGQ